MNCAQIRPLSAAQNLAIKKDTLIGEGVFADTGSQFAFDMQIFDHFKIAAMGGWRRFPIMSEIALDLTSHHQCLDKTIQYFVFKNADK